MTVTVIQDMDKEIERSQGFDELESSSGESFWQLAWKEFRKNKPGLYSLYMLGLMALMAIGADLIAGNKPYYMVYNGETYAQTNGLIN